MCDTVDGVEGVTPACRYANPHTHLQVKDHRAHDSIACGSR